MKFFFNTFRFTPEAYIKCLIEYRPKVLFLVPSLLLFLATHPSVTKDHLSSIIHITVGAAPASVQVIEKFKMKAQTSVFIAQGNLSPPKFDLKS
jgi:4-coumarate--CoA ligase